MSDQPVIEPAKFARGRGRVSGALTLNMLPRVADLVSEASATGGGGTVGYHVSGYVDERGYPALHIELDGDLTLRCQRCLGSLPHRVQSERNVVLVPGADEFAQRDDESESEDVIPEVPRLDLGALLEEELLLALPLAPRHEEGACRAAAEAQSPDVPSPFAALARLKR
jgi:uncharacterized protein